MSTTVNSGNPLNRWNYMSAYAIAVKHGFRGTEEEWLADLYGGKISAERFAKAAAQSSASAAESASEADASKRDAAEHRSAAERSAEAARESEVAAAAAAAGAEAEVLESVPGMVKGWLDEHIGEIEGYVLDDTLTVEDAAADAKAAGDAIKASHVAVDALGSVFPTQNALYLHNLDIADRPEYEFVTGDYDTGRWYKSGDDFIKSSGGYNTSTHPVDIDDSMVVVIPPGAWDATYSASFAIGVIEDNAFVPKRLVAHTIESGCNYSLLAFKGDYENLNSPKIILQTGGTLAQMQSIRLLRKNPMCTLTELPRVNLNNGNVGMFAPFAASESGRICQFYSTRLARQTTSAVGNGVCRYLRPKNGVTFFRRRQVRVGGTAKTPSSYSVLTTTAVVDAALVFGAAGGGYVTVPVGTVVLDTAPASGVRVEYEFIVDAGSTSPRRAWHQWLYADGLPLDAIFYDENGDEITWFGAETSVNGCLDWDKTKQYPSCIRIPDAAVRYHLAVYGPTYRDGQNQVCRPLGAYLGAYLDRICAYGHVDHSPVYSQTAGQAIANAQTLLNWTYPAQCVSTRYHLLDRPSVSGYQPHVRGIVYAEQNRGATLGTHISFYTYLSLMYKAHGYNRNTRWSLSRNAWFGLVCASLVSLACGLQHYQGVEYWIHKYADRLEILTPDKPVYPGDLLVTTKYFMPRPSYAVDAKNLNTHVALVTDSAYDRKSGLFVGIRIAEEANIWTRHLYWQTSQAVTRDSNDIGIEEYDPTSSYKKNSYVTYEGVDYVCIEDTPAPAGDFDPTYWREITIVNEAVTWRLPMPIPDMEQIENCYRFAADKELKPLSRADSIVFPPVMSEVGDRCIIGGKPIEWTSMHPGFTTPQAGLTFSVEKAYTKINIYKDGVMIAEELDVGTNAEIGTDDYYVIDLSEIIEEPGEYEIEALALDDGNYVAAELRGKYLYPAYPAEIERGPYMKTVTITGAYLDEDGRVKCPGWDDIWLRVTPHPAKVDGYPDGLPWGNYMFIPASEVWDAAQNCMDIGDNYLIVSGVTLINDDYGGASWRFGSDYDIPPAQEEVEHEPA